MKKTILILVFAMLGCNQIIYSQLGKEHAKHAVAEVLKNPLDGNFVDNERFIIKDKETAISVVEPILFSIYGKVMIMEERPYEIYLIDNYWLINGILHGGDNVKGGTFLIIIDARNSKVLKIMHGK